MAITNDSSEDPRSIVSKNGEQAFKCELNSTECNSITINAFPQIQLNAQYHQQIN
jgi:hypothetical protein